MPYKDPVVAVVKQRERSARWRRENPERSNAKWRKWAANHPEQMRERATSWQCTTAYRWSYYRSACAKKRGVAFSLPRALFDDLITDACFYCGAPPNPLNGVDRVDNTQGYTPDNSVTACEHCNKAKRSLSRVAFERWIVQVYTHCNLGG